VLHEQLLSLLLQCKDSPAPFIHARSSRASNLVAKAKFWHPTMTPKSCVLCPKQSQQVLDGPHVIIHGRRRIGFGCRAVRREVCRYIQHAASPRASRLPHPAALAARVDVVLCTYNARPSSATVKSASSLQKKGQN
jgi:hypothetical protein